MRKRGERGKIKQLCTKKRWVTLEWALFVAGIVGKAKVIRILEAEPAVLEPDGE